MATRTPDYYDGLRDGIRRYARWSPQNGDGRPASHVVGGSDTPLDDALARIDREQAKATANGTVTPRTIPVAEVIEVIGLLLVPAGDPDAETQLQDVTDDLRAWRDRLNREAS